jgi:hypothetical protein
LRKEDIVQGRITEEQLPMAEQCFPGICQVYEALSVKPTTFLQLLWIYEEICEKSAAMADLDLGDL